MKKIAFISGVARSGTSALVNFLNCSDALLFGQERYFFPIQNRVITSAFFGKDRFLGIIEGDTHKGGGLKGPPAVLAQKYDHAAVIGDKFPNLFMHFDYIFRTFPEAPHIYIVRNPLSVAESYQAVYVSDRWKHTFQDGLKNWNRSVDLVTKLPAEIRARFHIIEYETFFAEKAQSDRTFAFLGVEPPPEAALAQHRAKFAALNQQGGPRRDDIRRHVARHANWAAYNALLGGSAGSFPD